jgi:ERF superfamily
MIETMSSEEYIRAAIAVYEKRPGMPPEIAKAIVTVMAQIETLTKDAENKFAKYNYVSVDQFYDLIGRKMAAAGLFVLTFEKSIDISKRASTNDRGDVKESVWLSAVYDVFLYHESGASFGPVERSISVPASGAQAYASAQSFVAKYFLRGLFMVPTGDGDADGDEKRDLGTRRESRDDTADSKRHFLAQAKREWAAYSNQAALKAWWTSNKQAMMDIFDDKADPIYLDLAAAFKARGAELPIVETISGDE